MQGIPSTQELRLTAALPLVLVIRPPRIAALLKPRDYRDGEAL
jgi:hypothetical protein